MRDDEMKKRMTDDVVSIIYEIVDVRNGEVTHASCQEAAVTIIKRISEYADEDFGREQ